MEFFSPVSDVFTEKKEFSSIIRQAKDCQLNYSLKKISEFNFFDDAAGEVFPENTPEILIKKRSSSIAEEFKSKASSGY